MIKALSVSVEENLQSLSQYLWAINIAHRISEQAHHQVIWVASEADRLQVQDAYQLYQQGQLPEELGVRENLQQQKQMQQGSLSLALEKLRAVPFISLMVLVSVVATILLETGAGHSVFELLRMGTLDFIFESGQLWRLITPIFLHFDVLHLAFNMVLLWVFGRQLELHEKRGTLLILLLLFAVIPNVGQNLLVGIRFGGMSGLVYAVLGFFWLYNRLCGTSVFAFPNAMMGLMVGWLLLGFTDVLTWLGFPPMANIAHLGGLLTGLVSAWAMVQLRFFQQK